MNTLRTLLVILPLTVLPAAAQWRSTTYALKQGWNSIYLNGDATWQTLERHFAAQPDIVEVWRWNPNPDQTQFSTSPSDPSQSTPEWSAWRLGQPQYSDLALFTGQSSYLVKLRDGAPAQPLTVKQRVEPPVVKWLRSGANLLAFPARKNGALFPTISSYFGMFPAATASKLYRYNGGALDTNNPVRVFSPGTERLDSTQAYWFEAKAVSDYIGPLHFEISDPTGLNFGKTGSSITVTVRNRSAATQTLTFAMMDSEPPPAGQPAIAGPVVLNRRDFNVTTAQDEDTPFAAPFTLTVTPNGSTLQTFTVNRAAMSGGAGTFFASILRITDAGNMMDVYLPVSAGAASLSGLWIGDAELTAVESKVPGFTGTAAARPLPLRYILHVDGSGRTALLSQVFMGILAGADGVSGISTAETLLAAEHKAGAVRLTAAHMPLDRTILTSGSFSPGGAINGTIDLPFNDPTNPFVHQYHPDHDNKNARFQPVGGGIESYSVNRAVTFTFPTSPPAGEHQNWGSRVLTGTYAETITGIHKLPITIGGTFTLRRVSENGVLTVP